MITINRIFDKRLGYFYSNSIHYQFKAVLDFISINYNRCTKAFQFLKFFVPIPLYFDLSISL
jgi:hypothetical protein